MRAIQITETGGPDVLRLAENGSLRITIGGRYPLADAGRAHQDLQGRRTTGKLLLLTR